MKFLDRKGGMMRYTNSDLDPQSESAEFQRGMDIKDKENRSESDRIFLWLEEEKREDENGKEENFNNENARESELSNEQQLKRRIFWFFIEYFFDISDVTLKKFMKIMERNIILRALAKTDGDQKKAAEILGLKYTTLNEKIKRYQIRIQKLAVPEMPAPVENRA